MRFVTVCDVFVSDMGELAFLLPATLLADARALMRAVIPRALEATLALARMDLHWCECACCSKLRTVPVTLLSFCSSCLLQEEKKKKREHP